ncbi:MAG: glycosyl hydrolase family 57 [bacterium]
MSDIINGLPNICGNAKEIKTIIGKQPKLYAHISNIDINNIQSAFGMALHMHQPTIPAQSEDLTTAGLISNLQYMMERQHIHDNHNAPVFLWCYSRMSDFIRELVGQGKNPRIMLDYSGNLLWGLRQIENGKVLDNLKLVTCDQKYYQYVEWLGTMWSHAVVSSTPVPDIKLHIQAWREHFASIFGLDALARVKGFSPPEMHLPIHPDVCFEYVRSLKDAGYEWLMVQEHTIENADGTRLTRHNFPHRLVAKNSLGETEEIAVLIKTKGSDTKLVAQMQPYHEAKSINREKYNGKSIPPFVLQIADGENGGVMMNEFPPAYKKDFQEIGTSGVVAMNGSEYLGFIKKVGIKEKDLIPVQPISQHKIWEFIDEYEDGAADKAIEKVKTKYHDFNLDKASWTSNISWVKGYDHVLSPINKLSAEFHERFDGKNVDQASGVYREALLYLLLSQTSCFRYWGDGKWTDYAKELCRRGMVSTGIK